MVNVAIIILHFGKLQNTKECLESISKLKINNYKLEIIVVDNAAEEQFKGEKVKIIRTEKNLGYAGGNNVGIKHALRHGADYIVILNNDTIVSPNLIVALLQTFKETPNTGIISPKIYFAPGFEFHKERYKRQHLGKVIWYMGGKIDWNNILVSHKNVDEVDKGQFNQTGDTDSASGACMMIKKEVFEKIGLLDDTYFLYWEDADFSQRAKKAGFRVLCTPNAFIWHKASGSSRIGGQLHDYYLTRNRLLFGMRYGSVRSKFALIRESIKLLFSARPWQKRAVIDFYLGRLGKGSYPLPN